MKRLIALTILVLALAGGSMLASGAGDSSGGYEVRAIFHNAFSVIPGEDVKIAGVKVGKIKSLDVTADQQAAVVLDITKAGFQDFRKDATCTIRPQSLIGEKFVECTPTEPRVTGAQPAPPLDQIKAGPGKGQYLLPATQTIRPVDIDLLNNIARLPYRQRLSVLINEFGTGLAARGGDLRRVIRNTDPGLRETDRVLKILASQNRVLARLARDSDVVLAPLARDRQSVADFVDKAAAVNTATAERSAALQKNIELLPQTLNVLKPTMARLGALADQATPVFSDLGAEAPSINKLIQQQAPFVQSATPYLTSLGSASIPGRKAVVAGLPLAKDLRAFASTSLPLAANLKSLLTSFRDTGGIERLLDYIFYQVAAINGFDQDGHYLRAQLLVNICSVYSVTPDSSCTAKFASTDSSTRASARAALASQDAGRSPYLAREDAVLRGLSPAEALGRTGKRGKKTARQVAAAAPLRLPTQFLPGGGAPAPAEGGPTPTTTTSTATTAAPAPDSQAGARSLLDYLLGGG